MAKAYVLINTEVESDSTVWSGLKEVREVKEASTVYGVYDIIARVEAETLQELKDAVSLKIRRLKGIKSTLTMIVID
jgi:DNA-binding Lrp family transcriptional regulator